MGVQVPLPYIIERDGAQEKTHDLYARLLRDRIIFIGTPIDHTVANAVVGQLLFLEADDPTSDIYMYINTPGGEITAGLAIYDTMQYIKCPINTVCIGRAYSLGCFLLTAGAPGKRFSLPHSRIMLHQAQGQQYGAAADIAVQYEEFLYLNNLMLSLISQHTSLPLEEVRRISERDKYMSPEEAKELNFIDAVQTESMRIGDE